jgi:hypothetical protein
LQTEKNLWRRWVSPNHKVFEHDHPQILTPPLFLYRITFVHPHFLSILKNQNTICVLRKTLHNFFEPQRQRINIRKFQGFWYTKCLVISMFSYITQKKRKGMDFYVKRAWGRKGFLSKMLCPLVHCFNLYSYTNLEKKIKQSYLKHVKIWWVNWKRFIIHYI